ncbi:MAG: hypothetical protein CVV03_07415 [Firmicutes bacterium HGW-Firmicutes-8]|nr:MAG: hypothetical protein CVV03_07415 [Firmicutes bacterium HGW-Firmicutes-8]
MGSIGDTLRSAREAKGISLKQAEDDTKIRKRYLQALEDGDYEIIPGRVYAKGFLRNYAGYLGLNQEELMMEFKLLSLPVKENYQGVKMEPGFSKRRFNNRSDKRAYLVTVLVAVMAIVTLVVFNSLYKDRDTGLDDTGQAPGTEQGEVNKNTYDKPDNKPSNEQVNQSAYNPGSMNPANGSTQGTTPAGNVNITLNGKDGVCWARVTVDGTVKYTGNINPGESKTFTGADKIIVRLGKANAVEVIHNGQNLGILGTKSNPITKEFTTL